MMWQGHSIYFAKHKVSEMTWQGHSIYVLSKRHDVAGKNHLLKHKNK